MANLLPQNIDQWMRWLERRMTVQESRRPPAQIVDPLQWQTPRYNAVLSANFNATSGALYNIGFNVPMATPQHFDPDGLFTYQQVVPGGDFGVVVSRAGLYQFSCRVQQGGGTVAQSRKLYMHRHTDAISMYSSEDAPSPTAGTGLVSQVNGIVALQAGQGIVLKYRQTTGAAVTVIAAASLSTADPYASSTLNIVPLGAYNW